MKKATDISTVVKSGLCSGCGLCSSVAAPQVQMRMTEAGYLRPMVQSPLTPSQHQQVAASCPGMRIEHDAVTEPYHPIWGPLVGVATGYSTDAEVRHKVRRAAAFRRCPCICLKPARSSSSRKLPPA